MVAGTSRMSWLVMLCCNLKCSNLLSSRGLGSQYDTLGFVLALRRPATISSTVAAGPSNAVVACYACSTGLFTSVGMTARALVSLPAKLPNDIEKGFLDVDAVLGRGLNEVTAQIFSQSLTLLRRYFTLSNTIAFVAYEHNRCLAKDRSGCADRGAGVGRGASHRRLFDALNLTVEALYACKRGS